MSKIKIKKIDPTALKGFTRVQIYPDLPRVTGYKCNVCKEIVGLWEQKEHICKQKQEVKMIEEYEYEHQTFITCPYCGNKNFDSWEVRTEIQEGDIGTQECSCGKKFTASRYTEITYTSEVIKK